MAGRDGTKWPAVHESIEGHPLGILVATGPEPAAAYPDQRLFFSVSLDEQKARTPPDDVEAPPPGIVRPIAAFHAPMRARGPPGGLCDEARPVFVLTVRDSDATAGVDS